MIRYTMPEGPAITDQQYAQSALERPLSLWNTLGNAGAETWNQTVFGTGVREVETPGLAMTPDSTGSPKAHYRTATPEEVTARGDTLYQTDEQYRASPYARDDIPFEKGMTESRAKALSAQYDLSQVRAFYAAKRPYWSFAAGIGGAALAPENYIPIVGDLGAAATSARIGRIAYSVARGSADAALNTLVFQSLTAHERAQMGDDVSGAALLQNMAFAALAGAAFGGTAGTIAHFRERYAALPKIETPAVPRETVTPDISRPPPDLTIGGETQARFARPGEAPSAFIEPQVHPFEPVLRSLETPVARADAAHVLSDAALSLADTGEVRLGEGSQATIADMAGKAGATKAIAPDFAKWGVKIKETGESGGEQFVTFQAPDGTSAGQVRYTETPTEIRIEGLMGGKRGGVRGQATRSVKALIEYALQNGKQVRATNTGGAIPYWSGVAGFRKGENSSHVFDAQQAAKVISGDITTTAWPHERGYGDMFKETYGPMLDAQPKPELRTSHNFTAPPAEPLPQGLDNARVRVTEGVTVPKDAQAAIARLEASAKAEGLDPQTGGHDLETDMQILEATDRLTTADKEALKAADATYQAATAWGEALDSILRCKT